MKDVKIYGPGCKRCETTAEMMRAAAAELGIEVQVEKVTDMAAIARAGVMSTPGISVDGKLVHAGGLPDPEKLAGWLQG
ncbi:thioredoxin family protein [Paenirhodobacter sp. CAU 1674]|uniref:thioredoxin family protein n=1 Tax=Paenirhodobacter sp. CAU 1674 TaxID=3032596 RepID=UPI0023DA5BFF|nr:thioredoxin family protein [Paenirhodobacter sp. CAU 1674]MDF2140295.1 thioredoxin family protein [Paenirhodobacter sp. CAU 1674]